MGNISDVDWNVLCRYYEALSCTGAAITIWNTYYYFNCEMLQI